ncbi:rRNA adenine N(6)-methyltransferase family protein [Streptomyces sp. PmtG]
MSSGQNFLTDQETIDAVVALVARTQGPIVEIGTGDGALTLPLEGLGRPLTGVEIDGRRAERLARRTGPSTRIVHADFLRYDAPSAPHVLVGNLPFHATTPMLRRILRSRAWTDAVLLVQWEVARRRAGVGGATLMTAQWWPWYAFGLDRRVPSAAFRPRPAVDGGLLTVIAPGPPPGRARGPGGVPGPRAPRVHGPGARAAPDRRPGVPAAAAARGAGVAAAPPPGAGAAAQGPDGTTVGGAVRPGGGGCGAQPPEGVTEWNGSPRPACGRRTGRPAVVVGA